ncbi:unnamed protein product [Hydatigera taeniaeformis]|uniref:CS domain-containing protein n=1 Tax=Hydatigena taeniaeformis TaxID=6205 RepID=A0A0R3WZT0_HYDTA|nr:unnamed protein product [Hydatigera taeniaeformis]
MSHWVKDVISKFILHASVRYISRIYRFLNALLGVLSAHVAIPSHTTFVATESDIEYTIQIPDLKIIKKLFGPNSSDNGKIDCEISETGFNFKFVGSKDLAGKNYVLFVSSFPSRINPYKSSWKPRNGAVDVKLRVLVSIVVSIAGFLTVNLPRHLQLTSS